ncbi:MAG: TIGR04283 family arsenosugar biosynthesis glycosyltransferase [Cycloclasticus sp.]|nr:TIGR04283 family arsenosugar biosynthesis glycosyltransferase [Cycloclasticus sp.]MBQ0790288.1 TIGR04283 family arsenosugar biosynthesis glycosyltransferase [Cycloclasticus sp.]
MQKKIAIIIPTLNEAKVLPTTLLLLQPLRQHGVELIVVDGGSVDKTREAAQGLVDHCIESTAGRAHQMNQGASLATADLLVFLHADTQLPDDAYQLLNGIPSDSVYWGRFNVRLDGPQWAFRLIEHMMNWRSCLTGMVTGDQVMFVSKALFERVQGFPSIALMEDIAISKRLKKYAKPVCLKSTVLTSSRRWKQQGILRTVLLMWCCRLAYFFNADPAALAKKYANRDH